MKHHSDTISFDMIKYAKWYHITISHIMYGRYITKWDSDKWCEVNCEGKWHRGFYKEPDGLHEAIYFKLEVDRFKFIFWM